MTPLRKAVPEEHIEGIDFRDHSQHPNIEIVLSRFVSFFFPFLIYFSAHEVKLLSKDMESTMLVVQVIGYFFEGEFVAINRSIVTNDFFFFANVIFQTRPLNSLQRIILKCGNNYSQ